MNRAKVVLLTASLAGLVILPLLACDTVYDPDALQKYTEIRGTVRIPAELKPLVPSEAAEGPTVQAGDPGNCYRLDEEIYDLGRIEADEPALLVKGEIADVWAGTSLCYDTGAVWFRFQVNKKSSVRMSFTWENGDTDCFVAWIYDGLTGGYPLATHEDCVQPGNIDMVLTPDRVIEIFLFKWFETPTPTKYQIALSAVSGTVVGDVMVGAYADPAPFRIVPEMYDDPDDAVGSAEAGLVKPPVGGTSLGGLAQDPASCDADGNCDLIGWFDGLLVPVTKCSSTADCVPPICKDTIESGLHADDPLCVTSPCVDGYCAYYVYAFADNDKSNTLNLADARPNSTDFVMSDTIEIPNSRVDFGKGWKLYEIGELQVDMAVTDSDYDGVPDEDVNGDGLPDDNCPMTYNPNQLDGDEDLVGDECDVCPDGYDPDQTNTDGVGPGDLCNHENNMDVDGDEIDYDATNEDDPGDNCPDVANPDQEDLDNDDIGDACDPDIDNDGKDNEVDNCPAAGNPDQGDADTDQVGDACDNCRGDMSSCLASVSVTGDYENVREEFDAKWVACERVATMTIGECDGIQQACVDSACSDCRDSGADCYAHAGCSESDVAACEEAQVRCVDKCDKYPNDVEQYQNDCYESCEDDRNSCVNSGGCSRKDFDRCMLCTDVCAGLCADYYSLCLSNGVECSGASCGVGNPDQTDTDGDGIGDECDADDDNDGVLDDDEVDGCELVENSDIDTDGDGIFDGCDNCPRHANDDQDDSDSDGVGDECDNCIDDPNPDQANTDHATEIATPGLEVQGDECDDDDDSDSLADDDDSCPSVSNPRPVCTVDTVDADCENAGGICVDVDCTEDTQAVDCLNAGGACVDSVCVFKVCIGQVNSDDDNFGDMCDNCPADDNANQADFDGDDIGDECDNCMYVANTDQSNLDVEDEANEVGDACDPDDDGDSICDPDVVSTMCTGNDNCPSVPNRNQADDDQNGIGDACDDDSDGDGIVDGVDVCPDTPTSVCLDDSECGAGEGRCGTLVEGLCERHRDGDGDGLGDMCDVCEDLPATVCASNADCGSGEGICNTLISRCTRQADGDGDGIGTACGDNCPEDANADQLDNDDDDIGDACDSDDDNDGVEDVDDNCVFDANAGDAGQPQEDTDEDMVGDACDNCVDVKNADQADVDEDGDGDACDDDADGDGVLNVDDNCPLVDNPLQEDANDNGIGDACEESEVQTDFFEVEPNDDDAQMLPNLELGYDYTMTGYLETIDWDGTDFGYLGDWDVFMFNVNSTGYLRFELEYPVETDDYDLLVFYDDGEGWWVVNEWQSTDNPQVGIIGPQEDVLAYGMVVVGKSGNPGVYQVRFGFNQVKDTEPNDDLPIAQDMGPIEYSSYGIHLLGNLHTVAYDGGYIGDWDMYTFTAPVNGMLSYNLVWATADYDYDIYLYDGVTGDRLNSDGATSEMPEVAMDVPVLEGQKYMIAIVGYEGAPGDYVSYVTYVAD